MARGEATQEFVSSLSPAGLHSLRASAVPGVGPEADWLHGQALHTRPRGAGSVSAAGCFVKSLFMRHCIFLPCVHLRTMPTAAPSTPFCIQGVLSLPAALAPEGAARRGEFSMIPTHCVFSQVHRRSYKVAQKHCLVLLNCPLLCCPELSCGLGSGYTETAASYARRSLEELPQRTW